jgi:ubiquinone biosynthesis protein
MVHWTDLVRRSREVVGILVRHGLGSFTRELGLRRWPALLPRSRPRRADDDLAGVALGLRCALEEMGPTFVKLGQILSTRADLLPPAVIAELVKLQDAAPAAPWSVVRPQLERELGRGIDEAFAELSPEPFAAASLGQVHAGVLPGGEPVAVKVLRPGVERQVELDLGALARLARLAARQPALAGWDPEGLVDQLGRTLRGELDYRRERQSMERFAAQHGSLPWVRVPRLYAGWCSQRVLTMERIGGVRIDDLPALQAIGGDRSQLAHHLAELLFRSALQHGFFHADPHPGNFRVLGDGTLVVLDFGMTGFLTPRQREATVELLLAVVAGDAERCTDRLLELGLRADAAAEAALRRDLAQLLFDFAGLSFGELPMNEVLGRILELIRTLDLRLPAELALLVKTVLMAEGLGARLDPGFRLVPVARPLVREALWRRWRPASGDELGGAAMDLASAMRQLPARLRRLGDRVDRGDLRVDVRLDPRPVVHELERVVRTLRASVLAAAAVVAMGLLTLAHPPPSLPLWAPWLYGGGLAATLALLGYLVVDGWRARRL